MGLRRRLLTAMEIAILVGAVAVAPSGIVLSYVSAAPLRQSTGSVTIVSDGSEAALLSASVMDPDPYWRSATFDDSSWQGSYLAATLPGWGSPVGGVTSAIFIWGGPEGAPPGNIPTSPAPQFLFLRRNFCIPINASVASIQAATLLDMHVAASPGLASVYYNGSDIALSLAGREDGFYYALNLEPSLIDPVRRAGRNTLAINVEDAVADTLAAVAYHLQFTYAIDDTSITLNSGSAIVGEPVVFSRGGTGPGGDGPYTFYWDFGDGKNSTEPSPSKVYWAAGTYTVTLTMTDSFGCPSSPVTAQYVVSDPTPTLTNTPTPTDTPTSTNTPAPLTDTPVPPPPPPPPADTPVSSPTPTPTLTPTVPLFLPETGDTDWPSDAFYPPFTNSAFLIVGAILLVVGYLLLRRRLACRD